MQAEVVHSALPTANILPILLGLLTVLVWQYRDNAIGTRRRPDLKQERSRPLIGQFADLFTATRQLERDLKALLTLGPVYTRTVPFMRAIAIQRPDYIAYVQKENRAAAALIATDYIKGDFQALPMRDVLGQGIFATDHQLWHAQRKAAAHIFTRNSFQSTIQSSITEHTRTLVDRIRQDVKDGKSFALNDLFLRYTLDSFVKMTMNQELKSIQNGSVPFATSFDFAQERINKRVMQPGLWQITEKFSQTGRDMRKAIKVLDDYCYDVIDSRAASIEAGKTDESDLLGLFASVRDESGSPLSRKQLRDAILNLIIAGRDTTAQALAWCFYYLISDWEKYAAPIREEAAKVLGDSDAIPTYENHTQLIKALAVFHEALRLHPSVAKNAKIAMEDDQIPNGPFVEKGNVVFWSDWSIARDPNGPWGADAIEFKPFDRWIDDQGKLKRYDNWQFHAFNGGPRLCLGQRLAIYEGVSAIVAIVNAFDLEFAEGFLKNTQMTEGIVECGTAPEYVWSLTLPMKHPMDVKAKIHSNA